MKKVKSAKKMRAKKTQAKKPAVKAKAAPKAAKTKKLPAPKPLSKTALKAEHEAGKRSEARKKLLSNPVEMLLDLWKPRVEGLEVGLERLLEPVKAEKDFESLRETLRERIVSQMRKEMLSPGIEEQLLERFPKDRIHKIASIWSMKPRVSVRLNTLKADLKGFGSSLVAEELKIKRGVISPWGFEVGKAEEAKKHPVYERGLFDFQDESSQMISLFANARPGQRILDLSAGDGETSLALSAMMRNKGSVFVYDPDSKKIKSFKDRADKAGIDNYRVLSDSQIGEVKSLDSVLIRATSSNLGNIGLQPEIKHRFHKDDIPRIHKLQAAFLREGARKLKLGGIMIYATHSLNKSENEQQIDHFIRSTHNSYRVIPASQYFKESIVPYVYNFFSFQWNEKLLASFFEFDPYFVLSPDVHSSAGCFIGVIQRIRIST